jgi:CXXC-20-CXXC protein
MKKEVARKTCLNCGHEFTYKERLQSSYRLFWRMYCKECGARYSVQIKYRLIFGLLCGLPVAFGPSLIIFLEWNTEHVLIAELAYLIFLLLPSLFVIPILPLKWDPKEEAETPAAEKHPL